MSLLNEYIDILGADNLQNRKKIHWYNEAVSYRNKCVRLDILVKNSKIHIEDQHETFLRGFYDFYSDFNCRYI